MRLSKGGKAISLQNGRRAAENPLLDGVVGTNDSLRAARTRSAVPTIDTHTSCADTTSPPALVRRFDFTKRKLDACVGASTEYTPSTRRIAGSRSRTSPTPHTARCACMTSMKFTPENASLMRHWPGAGEGTGQSRGPGASNDPSTVTPTPLLSEHLRRFKECAKCPVPDKGRATLITRSAFDSEPFPVMKGRCVSLDLAAGRKMRAHHRAGHNQSSS